MKSTYSMEERFLLFLAISLKQKPLLGITLYLLTIGSFVSLSGLVYLILRSWLTP